MKAKITFYASNHDLANIDHIKQHRPRWSSQVVIAEGLRVLRDQLDAQAATAEKYTRSASQDLAELFPET